MHPPGRNHRTLLVVVAGLGAGLALLPAGLATEEPPPSPPFREAQQVTAVDVMVEVAARRDRSKEAGEALPSYLNSKDFEVVYDGETSDVVGVSAFGPAQHLPDKEPWTLVLYFDRRLANPAEISWAAAQLVESAPRLTSLGQVEVVVADPDPVPLLEPTRAPELLGAVLAELALFPAGDDHEVLKLRDEFLAEVGKADSEIDPGELAAFAVAEEQRIVRRQLDAFLTLMADAAAGTRRAVFLATAGFDLEPQVFYRRHLARSPSPAAETGGLDADLVSLERTLAAYGWITFPLVAPQEEGPGGGLRIGKWLMGKPRGELRPTSIDPLSPHDMVAPVLLNFFNLTRQGNQDEEKAEAYAEFGDTLAARGDWTEAEQAYRMALFHFADDPETFPRQTSTYTKLGEVLEQQGRRREARGAFERARELDPEHAVVSERPLAELVDPLAAVDRLARWTTGAVISSAEGLSNVLGALPYRVRVTYQLPGAPDGALHPLEVRCRRRGCELNAPGWARSGTPAEVSKSRIRRWLADDQYEGDVKVTARLAAGADRLEVESALPDALSVGGRLAGLRVTLGFGEPESIAALRHEQVTAERAAAGRWTFETAFERQLLPARERRGVAVLVEHLETGRWGATVVEVP